MNLLDITNFGSMMLADFAKLSDDIRNTLDPNWQERTRLIKEHEKSIRAKEKALKLSTNLDEQKRLNDDIVESSAYIKMLTDEGNRDKPQITSTKISLSRQQQETKKNLKARNALIKEDKLRVEMGGKPKNTKKINALNDKIQAHRGNITEIARNTSNSRYNLRTRKGDRAMNAVLENEYRRLQGKPPRGYNLPDRPEYVPPSGGVYQVVRSAPNIPSQRIPHNEGSKPVRTELSNRDAFPTISGGRSNNTPTVDITPPTIMPTIADQNTWNVTTQQPKPTQIFVPPPYKRKPQVETRPLDQPITSTPKATATNRSPAVTYKPAQGARPIDTRPPALPYKDPNTILKPELRSSATKVIKEAPKPVKPTRAKVIAPIREQLSNVPEVTRSNTVNNIRNITKGEGSSLLPVLAGAGILGAGVLGGALLNRQHKEEED